MRNSVGTALFRVNAFFSLCVFLSCSVSYAAEVSERIVPGDVVILLNKANMANPDYEVLESTTPSELHDHLVQLYSNKYWFFKLNNVENLNFGYEDVGKRDFLNMQKLVLTLDADSLSHNLPQFHWTMTDTYDYVTKNHQKERSRAWFTDPDSCLALSLGLLPVVKPAWEILATLSTERNNYVWLVFALPKLPNLSKMREYGPINCISDVESWPFEEDVAFYRIDLVDASTLQKTSYDAEEIVDAYYEQKGCCTLF